jgi:hypothetical protein
MTKLSLFSPRHDKRQISPGIVILFLGTDCCKDKVFLGTVKLKVDALVMGGGGVVK